MARRLELKLLWLIAILTLSGCAPATPSPTATSTALPPSPTATVEFPTLVPTLTEAAPAPDPQPSTPLLAAGEVLYQTDFSQVTGWPIGSDAFGAVSHLGESLSLVVPLGGVTYPVLSPAPASQDFVLEVQMRVEVCGDEDEYGVIFRAAADDQIRFSLTCSGEVRLRRSSAGSSRALLPFLENVAAVNRGAPANNRLSVIAEGNRLLLFVNDAPVLDTLLASPQSGRTGVFARTRDGSQQVTIVVDSFSLFELRPLPTPTVIATETPDG